MGCATQLTELIDNLSSSLDYVDEIEACVLNFAKAFDKVNYCKLTKTLYRLGVPF